MKMVHKSIKRKNLFSLSIISVFLLGILVTLVIALSINLAYAQTFGQTGNSVYDKACGTNIPDNGAAKEFLTSMNNMFGPDAEEAGTGLKNTYDCVNMIYEQETGNNIKTQLDDQYEDMNPLTAALLKDLHDGGIDDDGDGEGSDDKDDNDPDVQ
jgi:hypothetical protein